LTGERRSIVNKIDGVLVTLGVKGFRALRRDRRKQLTSLRQPDGDPVPQMARARIERLLDRLELVFCFFLASAWLPAEASLFWPSLQARRCAWPSPARSRGATRGVSTPPKLLMFR